MNTFSGLATKRLCFFKRYGIFRILSAIVHVRVEGLGIQKHGDLVVDPKP